MHEGIDLSAPIGRWVTASRSGRVIQRGWIRGYGRTIMIDHGEGWSTLYAHLSSYKVIVGQKVQQGQRIAQVGKTGRTRGSHLHFEIRKGADPLDPLLFLPRFK